MELTNLPVKGTADWQPEEFALRKYIFDTWRSVCIKFGYQEYLTPLVELADVYRAKSGEDAGGNELTVFADRGGRELAIRPEMTPSVTRMVSRTYNSTAKPIRLFSIANFYRNENPQKGRNREFWQLNADIFGSNSLQADVEVIQLAIEIMLAFGANSEQFKVKINDRQLIQDFVTEFLGISEDKVKFATRVLDKFGKISEGELQEKLEELGAKTFDIHLLMGFLANEQPATQNVINEYLANSAGMARLNQIFGVLDSLGYQKLYQFTPGLMRGFDYYDGMIFEVFDVHPDNRKALFGGGRYNGLAGIFGGDSFPAVGFAPGDETTKIFLETWNLMPTSVGVQTKIYAPLLDASMLLHTNNLAKSLRSQSQTVLQGLEVESLGNAFKSAEKLGCDQMLILGERELTAGTYAIKNLQTGLQADFKLEAEVE